MSQLPIPPHFDAANAGIWGYTPDIGAIGDLAYGWAGDHGIQPAAGSSRRNHLLIIDAQNDFTNPQGTLFVGGRGGNGAVDDCVRTAKLIYENLGVISHITPTLDTHFPFQIFTPSFWQDSTGSHPQAHTIITADQVLRGEFTPSPAMVQFVGGKGYAWLQAYVEHYCRQLEATGKYALYLWPYHCQLGSVGHALNGAIAEAVAFFAFARSSQVVDEIKGQSPFTENYSVLGPEVEMAHDGTTSVGQKNTRFIDTLLGADTVTIVGQAASHCVKSTITDLLTQIQAKDPDLARKVYVVQDCMSAVAIPDGKGGFLVDNTDDAEAALRDFDNAGMHVVKSTTPMAEWPDFKAA